MAGKQPDGEIICTSVLGMDTGLPIVQIEGIGKIIQITADNAVELGLNLLQCAEAARSDLALFRLMTERMSCSVAEAGSLVRALREFRTYPGGTET